MNIKEIAQRAGKKIFQEDGVLLSRYVAEKFATAPLAELSKDVEPAGYISAFAYEKLLAKSSVMGVEISNTRDKYHACALYTHPQPVEAIEQRVAEAIAKFVGFQRNDIPATGIEFAAAIRKEFVK